MRVEYDDVGDILYIERVPPYAAQDSHEISEGVITRSNPASGEVESLEIQGLRKRHAGEAGIEVNLDLVFRTFAAGPGPSKRAG